MLRYLLFLFKSPSEPQYMYGKSIICMAIKGDPNDPIYDPKKLKVVKVSIRKDIQSGELEFHYKKKWLKVKDVFDGRLKKRIEKRFNREIENFHEA